MFLAMTPQNAVRCVTCKVRRGTRREGGLGRYAPVEPLEMVRNKLRTLRRISWVRKKHQKGVL